MEIIYNNLLSVDDYCKLRKSVDFYDIPENVVRQALNKSDFVVTASINEITVGMARLITDGTQVLIMDVVVHPDYQNKGIGKGLMERIKEYIVKMDKQHILVNLLTDSTKIGFYEKLGYEKTEGMSLFLEQKG